MPTTETIGGFSPGKTIETYTNCVLHQNVLKKIYYVSLGRISALWSKYFPNYMHKYLNRGLKKQLSHSLNCTLKITQKQFL